MALLLPKGIVVNSATIEGNIESLAAESLDQADIARFWKVYTTTKRRLLDPTAERLENYWWRIWHSDRKHLNAITIARIFKLISDGPTFVPLRGPPNRHDGTTPPNIIQHGPGAASTSALHQDRPPLSGPDTGSNTTASSSSTSRVQVPMPHPILKKTRGPSTTGPRPTARFISPHESEHEPDEPSPISPNSHVVVQPPSPDPRDAKSDKKVASAVSRKKAEFPAGTRKKRPVISRRQSSQTSQSSDAGSREQDTSVTSADSQPQQGEVRRAPEQLQTKKQSRFQENFSPSPEKYVSSTLEAKKRSRTGDSKRTSRPSKGKEGMDPAGQANERAPIAGPGPSTQLRRVENQQEPVFQLTEEELEELEMQRILLAEANARLLSTAQREIEQVPEPTERVRVLHKSLRSRSAGNLEGEGMAAVRLMQHDSKGIPSLAPTFTDATGQLNLGTSGTSTSRPRTPTSPAKDPKGKGRATEASQPVDMFAKRAVQPAVIAPASEQLSRSKSQLTLLLRQDTDKKDRNKHESEKEHKRKK